MSTNGGCFDPRIKQIAIDLESLPSETVINIAHKLGLTTLKISDSKDFNIEIILAKSNSNLKALKNAICIEKVKRVLLRILLGIIIFAPPVTLVIFLLTSEPSFLGILPYYKHKWKEDFDRCRCPNWPEQGIKFHICNDLSIGAIKYINLEFQEDLILVFEQTMIAESNFKMLSKLRGQKLLVLEFSCTGSFVSRHLSHLSLVQTEQIDLNLINQNVDPRELGELKKSLGDKLRCNERTSK